MRFFGDLRILVLLLFIPIVSAVLPMPYAPWGEITINGEPAPGGLSVEAYIDGIKYADTLTFNDGIYDIEVPGDDPDTPGIEGGIDGDTITIEVNGDTASPALTWQEGLIIKVDLTVETNEPPEPENHVPVLDNIPDITVTEGELVQISASASDEDDDDLTYSIDDSRFTQNNNVFTWQTNIGNSGSYTVTVTVSDGSLTDFQQVHITVNQQQEDNGDDSDDNGDGGDDNGDDSDGNGDDSDDNNQDGEDNQDNNNYIEQVYKKDNKKSTKEKNPIKLGTIRGLNTNNLIAGDNLGFDIGFQNTGDTKMKDVKVTVIVPELGIISRLGPFDIKKGDSLHETVNLDIPEDAEPGEYYVKMVISSGNQNIVKYRPIYVE